MFECRELKKSYKETVAVNSLSFTVNKGEVFAFLGGNGAGKTTTIKMILGLVKPDEGKIVKAPDLKLGYSPETPYFPMRENITRQVIASALAVIKWIIDTISKLAMMVSR